MLKNILKLTGAQQLSKKEQNAINGGGGCITELECEQQCQFGGWCGNIIGTECWSCVPSGGGGNS